MNVQFDEGNYQQQNFTPIGSKGMAGWLINKGIAKDQKTAETIMLIFSVILLVITFINIKNNILPSQPETTNTPTQIENI